MQYASFQSHSEKKKRKPNNRQDIVDVSLKVFLIHSIIISVYAISVVRSMHTAQYEYEHNDAKSVTEKQFITQQRIVRCKMPLYTARVLSLPHSLTQNYIRFCFTFLIVFC